MDIRVGVGMTRVRMTRVRMTRVRVRKTCSKRVSVSRMSCNEHGLRMFELSGLQSVVKKASQKS